LEVDRRLVDIPAYLRAVLAVGALIGTVAAVSGSVGATQASSIDEVDVSQSLPGVSTGALAATGVELTVPAATTVRLVSAADAVGVALHAEGADSLIAGQPLLVDMRDRNMPRYSSPRLTWVLEVVPSHPIYSQAPGQSGVLGHAWVAFVDATTGEWLFAGAGDGLP
jgi:hypothetical protein